MIFSVFSTSVPMSFTDFIWNLVNDLVSFLINISLQKSHTYFYLFLHSMHKSIDFNHLCGISYPLHLPISTNFLRLSPKSQRSLSCHGFLSRYLVHPCKPRQPEYHLLVIFELWKTFPQGQCPMPRKRTSISVHQFSKSWRGHWSAVSQLQIKTNNQIE